MPSLEDYRHLAPFTRDELIAAVNAILGSERPRSEFSARTLRYYISEGVVPPPVGPPKFSRYTFEHLQKIVETRQNQDKGVMLEEMRWGTVREPTRRYENRVFESERPHRVPGSGRQMLEYRLTPRATLYVDQGADQSRELQRVLWEIEKILDLS